MDTQADISRITKEMGYKPKYSIVEAIENEIEFVQFYLKKFSAKKDFFSKVLGVHI